MPTSSAANGGEYIVSPRRSSLKGAKDINVGNGRTTAEGRKALRRSSSSQEIPCIDVAKENNSKGDEIKSVEKRNIDGNQNLLSVKPGRRRMARRRSSTSGTLLGQREADQTGANGSLQLGARRGSTSSSNPSSPRRGSSASALPPQLQSLSPRRVNSGLKFNRRNSSTSANFLSSTNRSDSFFQFPATRSEIFEYTDKNFLKGGLVMSEKTSVRVLEYTNEKEREEKDEIDKKLVEIEEERKHLEVLESAVSEWVGLLKGIHRLSKGVPLMRSITKACLAMNEIFLAKGGTYGASLLALRRCGLTTVSHVSADMEKLRAKIEKGGQELSLVDGKFLEDIREILGRIQGTLAATMKMFY